MNPIYCFNFAKMIISHKHKFIFLKTRKTAGTSIEEYLSKFCAPEDIITPTEEEQAQGQNYKGLFNAFSEVELNTLKLDELIKQFIKQEKYYSHIPAALIRHRIGEKCWKSYFKFSFERNPWDKCVSGFWYMKKDIQVQDLDFETWLLSRRVDRISNFNIYSLPDESQIDFIGKFEDLITDFDKICAILGIPFEGNLPRIKGDFRKRKSHYSTYYNEKTIKYIEQICHREIELFGYKFESI